MAEPGPLPNDSPQAAALIERRAWIRYGSDLQALCQLPNRARDMGWMARVRDVSAGGVGLLLRHRFRPGTPLLVELSGPGGRNRRVYPVRVVHATSTRGEGVACWLVGCAFLQPLSEEELQGLR